MRKSVRALVTANPAQRRSAEDVVLGDLDLVHPERAKDLDQDDQAGDDRRRAIRMQTNNIAALVVRHLREASEEFVEAGEADDVAVDAVGVVRVER